MSPNHAQCDFVRHSFERHRAALLRHRTVRTGQDQSVTETLQATTLVPILRPMMSQAAQLGAVPNTNALVIVDRYDNVRRITAVIEEIVAGFED